MKSAKGKTKGERKMKKFLLGVLIGSIVLFAFVYLGGARYVKIFGTKTEEAGGKLEHVEKEMKEGAETAKKTVEKTVEKTKEKVKKFMK